jgi:hypothetical protein
MKSRILLFGSLVLFCSASLYAQADTVETFFGDENDFRVTLGVSGGIAFFNPDQVNEQLAFVNNSLDVQMEKLTWMQHYAAFMRVKPRMAPYFLLRLEAMTVSRSFDYTADGRNPANVSTGSFTTTNLTRWTVYPLVIGVGSTIPKTPIDVEVGAVYAIGYITENGKIQGGGSYKSSSSGNGFGLQGRVAPRFKVAQNTSLSLEVAYRILRIRNYSDDFGRQDKFFEFFVDGMTLGFGLVYTFN